MMRLELLGNVRSPYVRRVRIVARELGIQPTWIDTDRPENEALLRELNPLWKMPVARIGEQVLFDSGLICRELLRRFGPAPLATWDEGDVFAQTLLVVIDGALEAAINAAYLGRDGITPEASSYVRKQRARAANALTWLERHAAEWLRRDGFGLVDVAWVTTFHTLRTRAGFPFEQHAQLSAWGARHADRPSVTATVP